MVGVEYIERECRLQSLERGRVPPHPQELAIAFNPVRAFLTRAKFHADVVNPTHANHSDGFGLRARQARGMFVTGVEEIA